MKNIQKLTLAALISVASSTAFAAGNVTIEVAGTDEATLSGATVVGSGNQVIKTGTGTLDLAGSIDQSVQISAGDITVPASTGVMPTGGFQISDPLAVDLTNASQINVALANAVVPVIALDADLFAQLNCNATGMTIAGVPTAANANAKLNIGGTNQLVVAADLSSGTAPIDILSGASMKVGNAEKMPRAALNVLSGGTLELGSDLVAGDFSCVAGTTVISGTLDVKASVPAYAAAVDGTNDTDFFNYWDGSASAGTLKFNSGATLKLANGVTWAREITVGTAK